MERKVQRFIQNFRFRKVSHQSPVRLRLGCEYYNANAPRQAAHSLEQAKTQARIHQQATTVTGCSTGGMMAASWHLQ